MSLTRTEQPPTTRPLERDRPTAVRSTPRRQRAGLLSLLACLALFLGWSIEWALGEEARDARASAHWPTAPGTITEARIVAPPRGDTPRARIRYSFQAEGASHLGSGVDLSPTAGRQRDARALVARYPRDATVEVHYKPGDPSVSALELIELGPWDELLLWFGEAARWGGGTLLVLAFVQARRARGSAA
jgi:hypothetical protein